jgi:hypothetical protein
VANVANHANAANLEDLTFSTHATYSTHATHSTYAIRERREIIPPTATVQSARVDVLIAGGRVLQVGSRQVTLSVYRQCDNQWYTERS